MTIAEIAKLAGVTTRAVRHYHRVGALPEPERRRNGYRDYDLTDLARLLRLRRMVDAGVPLRRIAQDWSALHGDSAREAHEEVQAAEVLSDVVDDLRRRRDELDARIERLEDLIASAREPRHDAGVVPHLEAWVATLDADARSAVAPLLQQDVGMLGVLEASGRSAETVTALRDAYAAIMVDPEKRARFVDLAQALDSLPPDAPPARVDDVADLMESLVPPALLAELCSVDPSDPEVEAWMAVIAPPPVQAVALAVIERRRHRGTGSKESS